MAGVRRGAALLAGVGGGGCRAGPCRAAPPPAARRGFAATALRRSYDVRRVEITPLEQRKVTFDTHALVQDLEAHGFGKEQAETIVSALITLSNVSLDTVYKDMVTQAQQEITLQQIMAHLDSIRKDMVILEKSEFANLRAENEKMKIELDQVKQQLLNETGKIRADNKLDINLERSRVTDMFTDQEKKLMEATTEFHKKDFRGLKAGLSDPASLEGNGDREAHLFPLHSTLTAEKMKQGPPADFPVHTPRHRMERKAFSQL
ncbi:coiled-coil domain-containing protein 90B, mitochondrial isoform X4 [Apteryx mantelli]|uniref:Coiled-coil domain-containing protein 90B, mitochondrial isoform X4 n=1 Tax=Apteryx mantelli TaxID=2696672 RepID=A0ABM4G6V0_9AVES